LFELELAATLIKSRDYSIHAGGIASVELVNLLRNAFVESQFHRDPWGVASLSPDTQIELLVSSWLHIYCELPRLAVTWFGIKSHYLQQPWLMRVDVFVTYERDNSPRSQDVCYPPPLHPPPPKKEHKKQKRNPTMTTERYKAARNA